MLLPLPPTQPASLDIVIVNWNSRDLLRQALGALAGADKAADLHVIVVDNASHDGSIEQIEQPGLRLTLLRNVENRGFGAACNQGAAAGEAPAILFLNPDTRVEPTTLSQALAYLAMNPTVGIVGVRQTDERGATLRTCARAPSAASLLGQSAGLDRLGLVPTHFMTEWDHADTRPVDQVMGAFLMIRRDLFRRLGGFDERYFVYYEDVDLCRSAIAAGFEVVHLAEPVIFHQTQGTTTQVKDRRLFYFLRSQALYAAKHHGAPAALALLAVDLLVQMPLRLAKAMGSGQTGDVPAVARATTMLLRGLPVLLPALFRVRREKAAIRP